METDPQERDSDAGEDSPPSQNGEEMSEADGESPPEPEDADSSDELRRHMYAEQGDVLKQLKKQVRDMQVLEDYDNRHQLNFASLSTRGLSGPEAFPISMAYPFTHPAAAFLPSVLSQPQPSQAGQAAQAAAQAALVSQPQAASTSPNSSDGSGTSPTWSYEDQFRQVRQLRNEEYVGLRGRGETSGAELGRDIPGLAKLYEITDDPRRKEFLDDLFLFMQKRGTPINRLPIMAKSVLDLFELYNLVIARGGLVDVINKKLWQEIIKGLHLPSSITSAAFTLRTQYMKYLYNYECEKKQLSTHAELQAAIDGNRREGRRSSYGTYDSIQKSPNPSQIPSLSLVSQQQQHMARLNSVMASTFAMHTGVHHPSHPQPLGQQMNVPSIAGLVPHDLETRMLEYMRMINNGIAGTATSSTAAAAGSATATATSTAAAAAATPLKLPYANHQTPLEHQQEALNLSEPSLKRETESLESPAGPPPKKFVMKEEESSKPVVIPSSTHIKISNGGDSRSGDNSLTVCVELNGITYQGVLFPQIPTSSRTALTS